MLFAVMGGNVIAVVPFIGFAGVVWGAAKTSSFKELRVRSELRKQQKNYVNQP